MGLFTFLRQGSGGTIIEVYVQPKASRNELAGLHQGLLKVRLTAPPVEGEANKECVRFLSKLLGVPRSRLEIVQGHKSRQKTILARDLPLPTVQDILTRAGVTA